MMAFGRIDSAADSVQLQPRYVVFKVIDGKNAKLEALPWAGSIPAGTPRGGCRRATLHGVVFDVFVGGSQKPGRPWPVRRAVRCIRPKPNSPADSAGTIMSRRTAA